MASGGPLPCRPTAGGLRSSRAYLFSRHCASDTGERLVDRRVFLAGTGLSLVAAPRFAKAQPAKIPRVGFVEAGSRSANQHFADAFRAGLRELGYVEGQNIVVEERWADGNIERFPDLVADLLRSKVDVIVQASGVGAQAAKKATSRVPIVFVGVTDAVELGLVESVARPGGNATGLTLAFTPEFAGKWVELLKEAVPRASHVVVLLNALRSSSSTVHGANPSLLHAMQPAAAKLGVKLTGAPVRDASALDTAFEAMTKDRVEGLIVLTDPLTLRHRTRIVRLANTHRLPTMYSFGEFARTGGLMAYGPSVSDMFRRAATYVDRILKGAKPAELPVEQPTKFELVINMKTASALALKMPPSLLLRADDVIR